MHGDLPMSLLENQELRLHRAEIARLHGVLKSIIKVAGSMTHMDIVCHPERFLDVLLAIMELCRKDGLGGSSYTVVFAEEIKEGTEKL